MPISRVQDSSPAGRVVVRSFRKLSQVRRNLPLSARPKIEKRTGLQKYHLRSKDAALVASKKRSAKTKGPPKKPKKLPSANPGRSAKCRHLPARSVTGTPGSIRQPRKNPSHARAPRTDFRVTQLNRSQPHVRKNSAPGGVERSVAELPEVFAKNLKIIDQVALRTQQFSQDPLEEIQITSRPPAASELPLLDEAALEVVDPPTEPTEAVAEAVDSLPQPEKPAPTPVISQAVATLLATARPDPSRITVADLEFEITQATRMADPSCAEFVGVVVQRVKSKSSSGANWSLRGIKFGRSDRKAVGDVLTTIVERMQREFRLSDE